MFQESARSLVHALIIGRIDYFKSLLSVHLLYLQRAERLQNAAARLMSNVPRFSHITPVLCSLHWLPVKFRIDLKYFLLLKPSTIGRAPGYFIDLTAITEQPRYNLRPASGLTSEYRVYSSALPCGISAIWKKKCRIKFTLPRQKKKIDPRISSIVFFFQIKYSKTSLTTLI